MAAVGAIRDRIKSRIDATVSGLHGYDTYSPQVLMPAYIVMPAPGQFLEEVTGDGCEDLRLIVLVLVKKVIDDVAQDAADSYLSEGASTNIANAIESGSTSDWDYAVASVSQGYGAYTFGEGEQAIQYLGFEIPVTVGVS